MNTCTLRHIDDIVDIGVVVVVCASGNFDISVSHPDVLCVDAQVFRRGHDCELDLAVRAECLVGPFPDGPDLLDGGDTVVSDEDLYSQHCIFPKRICWI